MTWNVLLCNERSRVLQDNQNKIHSGFAVTGWDVTRATKGAHVGGTSAGSTLLHEAYLSNVTLTFESK